MLVFLILQEKTEDMGHNIHINRIKEIKAKMEEKAVNVYLLPHNDPHFSEYPAEHWRYIQYVSGFSGSNAFLMLSDHGDYLWTDSRYYLQAEKELKGTGIQMIKEEEGICWEDLIRNEYGETKPHTLFDPLLFSINDLKKIEALSRKIEIELTEDFLSTEEMEELPDKEIFLYTDNYSGCDFSEKKKRIFEHTKANYVFLSSLEEIAWTFNLRGSDTPYTPVAIAYALLGRTDSYLFIKEGKVTASVKEHFKQLNINVIDYDKIDQFLLSEIAFSGEKISVDLNLTNAHIFLCILGDNYEGEQKLPESIINETSPVQMLKSIKNDVETQNLRHAQVKDGVALVNAIFELTKKIEDNKRVTEADVAEILKRHRSKQDGFFCESFSTIAGYGANGAIVHYSATKENCSEIGKESLLLVDSGASYLDGTTDITRVFCFGEPTEEQKHDYTAVLKGHIALATVKFPYGTSGHQLDAIAHAQVWNEGMNYGHGTGHGIGHFLCVHEGPQRISARGTETPLENNMVLSDEPGVYRAGKHGIRIENMMIIRPFEENEFGKFLQFETITLFPYNRKLIDHKMLNSKEIEWINQYNQKVYEKISPYIKDDEILNWLKEETKKV